jgi:hypothetical protein
LADGRLKLSQATGKDNNQYFLKDICKYSSKPCKLAKQLVLMMRSGLKVKIIFEKEKWDDRIEL